MGGGVVYFKKIHLNNLLLLDFFITKTSKP